AVEVLLDRVAGEPLLAILKGPHQVGVVEQGSKLDRIQPELAELAVLLKVGQQALEHPGPRVVGAYIPGHEKLGARARGKLAAKLLATQALGRGRPFEAVIHGLSHLSGQPGAARLHLAKPSRSDGAWAHFSRRPGWLTPE